MNPFRYIVILVILFALFWNTGCKKKKNDNPLADLKIASLDVSYHNAITHYRFVYDAGNNIDSIITSGSRQGYQKMNYLGYTYTITDNNGHVVTVATNTDGSLSRIVNIDTTTFTYSGNLLWQIGTTSQSYTYPYYVKSTDTYYWNNGDVSSVKLSNNSTRKYDYNMSQSGQVGDPIRIDQILQYGKTYLKTSHLPVDLLYNGSWVEKYFYALDGNGRIRTMTRIENYGTGTSYDTVIYDYKY